MSRPCKYGHNAGRTKDGTCKRCAAEANRKWVAANREKSREYTRKWRLSNIEKARENSRRQRAANIDKYREYGRAYARAKRGERLEYTREWRGLPVETRPCPELCEMGCGRKAVCLDHCHRTGAFRGWLCRACNLGLGSLGDTHEALQRAADYLVRAQSEMWLAIPGHGLPRNKQ